MLLSIVLIILLTYGAASIFMWRNALRKSSLRNNASESKTINKNTRTSIISYSLILIGLLSHFYLAASTSYVNHSFNFSFASMAFWISSLVVTLFLVGNLFLPIKNLALLLIPLSAICVLFSSLWGDQPHLIDGQSSVFYWHLLFSVAGFTVLSLCVLQSILFAAQEYSLKNKRWLLLAKLLPALQVMEKILLSLIWIGFILISIAIGLGFIVNLEQAGSFFQVNHHNILAILGWAAFLILLCGRYFLGWRGMQTVKWTLIGFVFIQLGYFGTKLVQEALS